MALQVWLPLNGNLENKGLANIKMTGTPVYSNGKIGKCVEFNATTTNIIYDSNVCPDLKYTDNFSFCLWVNNKRTSDDTAIQYVFTAGRADSTTYGYGIELTNPNFKIKFGSSSYSVTGTLNTWTHLAFTKQGTTIKIYKNGSLYSTKTFSGTLPEYTQYSGIGIGCFHYSNGNIYPSRCQVNDFRIYDHALSAKEVKEISKGLILHYKLDGNDIGITIPRNGGLIPDGVELYDYILSSGTLWIDTGVIANLYPIEFKTNLCFTDNVTTEKDFFGNFNDGASTNCFVCGKYSRLFYQWGGNAYRVGTVVQNQFYELSYRFNGASGRTLTIDGTANTSTATNNFASRTNTLGMFSGASNKVYCAASVKMKYSLILINDILVRNFLPCTYLGEPGMWDTVENKFYRNQGTGLFTLGNKITLKEYEYLEKNSAAGTYDYINTGVSGFTMNNIRCECKASISDGLDSAFFGTRGNYYLFYNLGGNYFWPTSKAEIHNGTLQTNTPYIVDWNKGHLTVKNESGTLFQEASRSNTTVQSLNLYIFNFNPLDSRTSQSKIYYFKIYVNDLLIRDFIPVSYNGTPGLWDKVEWKFYANAGSGSFTLGPEKAVQQDAPIFYDSSGYCNHGSITGTLTTNSDSPRYTASTNIVNSYITTTSHPFNEITISFWINRNSLTGTRLFIYTDWPGVSIELTAANGWQIYYTYSNNQVISCIPTTTLLANKWYHIVYVIGTTGAKIYVDGVCENTSEYRTPYCSSTEAYIGHYSTFYNFNAKLSDFRIYATALSEDDIKELYNTSAFVTNNGVFAEYELYEDNLSDVKKRGLLETANFYENGAESGYALDTDKTRVASNYIISEDFIEI